MPMADDKLQFHVQLIAYRRRHSRLIGHWAIYDSYQGTLWQAFQRDGLSCEQLFLVAGQESIAHIVFWGRGRICGDERGSMEE